ncbi:zinc-binding dehydrogenase [Nocardiopsis tropica]|uniref:Zinc-binding dehydrogenase n=1 Tax=Nocardiopsis tropica TaxID=109330 RepID=A0ABU7KNF4_9ACTN|nr:zinc-binding dehydrogenase [Nocardiopsis umidischolae]MEE2050662.1 zinc-binding dehydrogenase [Nocardiopsis umidischolae]
MDPCHAAVLRTPDNPMRVERISLRPPRGGEVLVRTMSAGICGTDLHFATGRFPYPLPTVLGHEASGIVEATGPGVDEFSPGDRVIVCDQVFCGRCAACLSGEMVYCIDPGPKQRQRDRLRVEGAAVRQYLGVSAFAEQMVVDATALIPMPRELSFEAGALLSCCLTTGMASVFNVAGVRPGSTVAILGCGGVGLGAVQAARISGAARIIATDLEEHRLQAACDLGATDTLNAGKVDITGSIQELCGGVDYAIEAVGLVETASQAFTVLRPGGNAVVMGMMPANATIPVPGRLLRQGRTLAGTVMGSVRTRHDIPRYAELALRGTLDTERLITSIRPLAQVDDAVQAATERTGIRELLEF